MQTITRSLAFLALLAVASSAAAAGVAGQGMSRHASPYSVDKTVERLTANAKEKGLRIFATVDHREGARSVDMSLRPTTVVIFGNPKGGTPFMQCAQTIGIDLPLKMLAWRDDQGQVWLGYNDPAYIAKRHGASDCAAVAPIANALAGLAKATIAASDDAQ